MISPRPRHLVAALATLASLASVACESPVSNPVSPVASAPEFTVGPGGGGIPVPPALPCTLGYPFTSSNPLTKTLFNESEVLQAFSPAVASKYDAIKVWYSDEHALTLGVRTTSYPVTAFTSALHAVAPEVGDPTIHDGYGRPYFPALYITDVTADTSSRSGDWQHGGTGTAPSEIFGTWKGASLTPVDPKKPAPPSSSGPAITTDNDPSKNVWNLGVGSDIAPGGFSLYHNDGYSTEIRWNVSDLTINGMPLQVGHNYRVQVMVHDGDQNKAGGDVGEACMTIGVR